MGSFAFASSVKPRHKKEEAKREQANQQEQVSAENPAHLTTPFPH
jgi:hypothetical protein